MIRTRASLIQLVEKNLGTVENPEMVEVYVGKVEFESTSYGELQELLYMIGGLTEEISIPMQGTIDTSAAPNDKPEQVQPANTERPVRRRRTKEQIEADNKAEAADLAESKGATVEETVQTDTNESPFKPTNNPPEKAPEAPKPEPVPPPTPKPVVTGEAVTPGMIAATKPRDVVHALFDSDKQAGREPRSVDAVVAFVEQNRASIPCIAAMNEDWKNRVTTIAETIRSALVV